MHFINVLVGYWSGTQYQACMSGMLEWRGLSVYEWDTGVVRSIKRV